MAQKASAAQKAIKPRSTVDRPESTWLQKVTEEHYRGPRTRSN
ncbi:hypothetical protein [Streptomyces siamensis]|uniref:Uncharacterized protein n=1 Tax=Streptomyces siamensis TaxID=1274986 RepID=A0ABP9JND9_9ACTN